MSGRLGMTGSSVVRGDATFGKAQGNKPFMVYQAAGGTRARVRRTAQGRRFRELAHPSLGLPPQNVEGWARRFEDPILKAPGKLGRNARGVFHMNQMGVGRAGKAPMGRYKAPPATVESQRGVARRGGRISKAIPHMQALEMSQRFAAKGKYGPAARALALSRRSGRVADKPKQTAYTQQVMRDKIKYRHEMALVLRDEGLPWSPPKRRGVSKVDTSMSEREAARLARRYDTRGPLPKGLSRDQKMKAYEARYIAAGGKKGEKWKRRADVAEAGRNIGLAGATLTAGALLASRGRRTGPRMARTRGLRRLTPYGMETTALASAAGGGGAELYGEYARNRRASYASSPAGVAGSALTRMQAYTPRRKS